MCRFYKLDQSLSKGPLPYASDWSTGGRNCWPSSDELFGCLSRVPSDTFSFEECRGYLLEDDDQDV